MSEASMQDIREIVDRVGTKPQHTIPLLQAVQETYRYLPPECYDLLEEATGIKAAAFRRVAKFYHSFRHAPAGEHFIHVCHGTACHVKGAGRVHDAILRRLGIDPEGDTDADRLFTVQRVACLGCCTLAPAVKIDEITYGHLRPETVGDMISDFHEQMQAGQRKPRAVSLEHGEVEGQILLGLGSCCVSRGSGKVRDAIDDALAETGASATIKRVGCVGMCHQTPLVEIASPGEPRKLYAQVSPPEARRIVRRHFAPRGLWNRVKDRVGDALETLLTDESWTPIERYRIRPRDPHVESFLSPQRHIANEHCGQLDPLDLDEYQRHDGFAALRAALAESSPAAVIREVTESGLAGRGGAGFPTGRKWQAVAEQQADVKYALCNGDEGDPGAFMDRMLLESHPFRVLEGMILAAWAVGAREGALYIRWEYPLAVERVRAALAELEAAGLLGENILGSGFDLHLRVFEGAGAFVCGEETALIESMEGRPGFPRKRPPFPAEAGLFQQPTLINNVETYANVPWILRHGSGAYRQIGTADSPGTKVFALAGKINRGGLIEVPMGISIRRVIEDIGGGVQNDRAFKAVQIGGPSGGCVPASLIDTPIDYQALRQVGAMMGSGGLVVLDETDCMVDIARYFLEFTHIESCGKCKACKRGSGDMLSILERLCEGEGRREDIEELEELCQKTIAGSLCGLGRTAPNPVLTTLRYFRDEYEAHIDGRCPAGVCTKLIHYKITDDCIGCTLCAQGCPVDAIEARPHQVHEIDTDKCVRCGACKGICPVDSVVVE